jgi:hypothetical protein
MTRIPADTLLIDPTRWRAEADKADIIAQSDGADVMVLLSIEEYRRLKQRDVRVIGRGEFTDTDLEAILAAEPPEEARRFDHEVGP